MMDERQRVVRDLLLRLAECGIAPEEPFTATHLPGEGWTFDADVREPLSSAAGDKDAEKVRTPLRSTRR